MTMMEHLPTCWTQDMSKPRPPHKRKKLPGAPRESPPCTTKIWPIHPCWWVISTPSVDPSLGWPSLLVDPGSYQVTHRFLRSSFGFVFPDPVGSVSGDIEDQAGEDEAGSSIHEGKSGVPLRSGTDGSIPIPTWNSWNSWF